ncbi:MAG TPA: hypothetical protein VGG12_02575, partial [Methylovirgula sp.]
RKESRAAGAHRTFIVVRDKAIRVILNFMAQYGLSIREVAAGIGMSEATLRLFLNGGHKVPPHKMTYAPLLELRLGDEALTAVLDFIEYKRRVAALGFLNRTPVDRARAELRVISREEDS